MTDFTKLLAAFTGTHFGDQLALLALPLIAALVLGVGPVEMGWLTVAATTPFFLFGLPAGVWIDRLPRRSVMLAGSLLRASALLALPAAALLDVLSLPLLMASAALAGIGMVFFDVASQSAIPALVERDRLIQANSRFEIGRAAATTGGPGFAGVLAGAIGPALAVLACGLADLAAAAFAWRISKPATPLTPPVRRSFAGDLSEGVRFLLGEPSLRALALCSLTWNIALFAMSALLVLYLARNLGLSAAEIGLVFAVDGVGMVLGALASGPIARRIGIGWSIILGPAIGVVGIVLILAATPATAMPLLIAGRFLFGFGPIVFSVTQTSLRQSVTPAHLLGRVNASLRWLTWGFRPVGALLGGLVGEVWGLYAGVALSAVGLALCLVPLVISPVPRLERLQA
ncbi:MAG: MFS transporter [Alphaproteobacteria bacterium]|nr:MFS transporter [Alphaproteobacteria bacterium]